MLLRFPCPASPRIAGSVAKSATSGLFRDLAKWKSALLVSILLAGSLFALYADPTDEENNVLKSAQQAYHDGAFDLAANRTAALLKKYPKTELLPQAELLEAQALYQLGRSDEALAALSLPLEQVPDDLRSDFLFWQAESLLDLERWLEAEQKYQAVLLQKNAAPRVSAAELGIAWSLYKQGKENDARSMIEGVMKTGPNLPAGQQAQLLLAKIDLITGQNKDAISALQTLLNAQPPPALYFEALYRLGQAYAAIGQIDQAVSTYQEITGDLVPATPPAPPINAFPKRLVAQAYLGLGQAEQALGQNDQAMTAFGHAYQLTENRADQLQAFRAFLEAARAAGQLPEAVAQLQEFAKGSAAAAPAALLAMGAVLAEDGQNDKAIGILESLLVAYGKSAWVPSANYQLGLLYAQSGKPAAAVVALQNCLSANPPADPALVHDARYQLGLVLLNQNKDPAGAAAQFSQISAGTDASAENATYNLLLAEAALGKVDAFLKLQADFAKRFPKSAYLKKIALAQGLLLTQTNHPDDAVAAYQRAIPSPGDPADQKALLNALANLQYQTSDLAGTLRTYQMIVSQFPADSLVAAQRAVLVAYEMKQITDDQAEQQLVALAQKYQKSPDSSEGLFRLGEFYFYRQDYVKAQDAFQQLTANNPNSPEAPEAYFFAGRAAAAHMDYTAALSLLEKVPDSSPFKADAQLAEGRVYQEQANFSQALTSAESVLAAQKAGPAFVAANLLKGQCLFEMGSKNSSSYQQAFTTFDQVVKSQDSTVTQRNEAAVRSAKCLEEMGQPDKAMGLYLDVLYGRIAGNDPTVVAPADFSWQIKAGWEAGRMREAQQDWRGAIEIYKRLEQIGGPHEQEFRDLENKLRRDNYIYE